MKASETNLEQVVLGYLCRHCRGAAAARKIWKVAEDLAILGLPNVSERAVREALAELRLQGLPVGTTCGTPPGAFLCEDRADFRRAYRNLYTRLRLQARGCRRLKQTFREKFSGQRPFQFAQAEDLYARLLAERAEQPLLVGMEV